jgi:WD40 repeat protein
MHPPSPESTRIVEDRSTRICSKRPHPRSILGPAWRTKTVRGAYRWRSEISCLQYSLDGRYFASGSSDHSIRLAPVHQMNQGIEAIILLGHRSRITTLAFSPTDSNLLAYLSPSIRIRSMQCGSVGTQRAAQIQFELMIRLDNPVSMVALSLLSSPLL